MKKILFLILISVSQILSAQSGNPELQDNETNSKHETGSMAAVPEQTKSPVVE